MGKGNKRHDPKQKNVVRRFLSVPGPGLITGAADDNPSGVATYTVAGAQLGTSLLWTAFITWPLMLRAIHVRYRDARRRLGKSPKKKCRPPHFEEVRRAAVPPRTIEVIPHVSFYATGKKKNFSPTSSPPSGTSDSFPIGKGVVVTRFASRWLSGPFAEQREQRPQFVKIKRFGQIMIEARFFPELVIPLARPPGQGDGFYFRL